MEKVKLTIGDKVLFRRDDQLYEGVINSIHDDKIEIDDKSIKLIVCAISKNTIADNISFTEKEDMKYPRYKIFDKVRRQHDS